ncbi:MAG: hypothetical protein K2X87_11420 [Gemmataceae bacterium]|nr:hypothetical protein [Gemmataceae bacterium]
MDGAPGVDVLQGLDQRDGHPQDGRRLSDEHPVLDGGHQGPVAGVLLDHHQAPAAGGRRVDLEPAAGHRRDRPPPADRVPAEEGGRGVRRDGR